MERRVGYKTYCNAYRTGEVGAITLEDATINLQKIVIKGHRKYISEEKAATVLKDGDNVEFLYFMGGGC